MLPDMQSIPIEQYPIADRIELLGRLWDSLLDSGSALPTPSWHTIEVARRVARADAEPGSAIPLEDLRNELFGESP
jgi:putative addiction module component (TIGR02574 family)